ncbi:MAG: RNA polymerase sigma factor [Flavisolibacter sp.]
MHSETDMAIITMVLKGDQNAYSILVERYKNFVFTIVLRYVKSREDAEEVAQDIFIKAYRYLADFKGNSKFSTWLYTITTTTSLSFLRKKKQDWHSLDNEHVFELADNMNASLAVIQMEQKGRATMVNEAIKMLGAEDASILSLFYKGENSLEEIAQILGKESNTVKVQLHRARIKLKDKMQKHFAEEIKDMY